MNATLVLILLAFLSVYSYCVYPLVLLAVRKVSGRRLPPEATTAALGAGPAAVDCGKNAFPLDARSLNRVNLSR